MSPTRTEDFAASLLTGRSPATFDRIWQVFNRVLKYAVRKKAIPTNPLDAAELGTGYATGDLESFTPAPLTAEQVAAVARYIDEERKQPVYGLVVLFAAYTSVRAGELAGLEIGDLTLDTPTPTLSIRRTKRRVAGEWETGTPKSRKSRRTVPLESWLADDLRAYLDTHPRRDDPTAPLFPNRANGGARTNRPLNWADPVAPGQVYENLFQPACKALGFGSSRWHDLRHQFAIMNLSAGVHYMLVSK